MTNKNPHLTITLTGRKPVKVKKADWPIIAQGAANHYDGQYDFQANRTSDFKLRVRQHEDGRAIVYGVYDYDTRFQGEDGCRLRGGEIIDADADVATAIRRVAEEFAERIGSDYFGLDAIEVGNQCIADLPAEEL